MSEATGSQAGGALAEVDSADVAARGKPSATAAAACLKLMASLDSRRGSAGGAASTHAGAEEGPEHSAEGGGGGRPAKVQRLSQGRGPGSAVGPQAETSGARLAEGAGPMPGRSDARESIGTPLGDSVHAGILHAADPQALLAAPSHAQAPPAVSLSGEPGAEGPGRDVKGARAEGAGSSALWCKEEPGVRTNTGGATSGDSHSDSLSAQAREEAPARGAGLATIRGGFRGLGVGSAGLGSTFHSRHPRRQQHPAGAETAQQRRGPQWGPRSRGQATGGGPQGSL